MDDQVKLLLRQLESARQARSDAERELRRERDFVTSVLDSARAVVLVVDLHGRIVRANAFAAAVSGIAAGDLVGVEAAPVFFAPEAQPAVPGLLGAARSRAHGDAGTLPLVTGTGERREFDWFHSHLPDPGTKGPLLLLVGRDATERQRLFREVERLSTTDPLTGLSNRRHFDSTGQLEVLRARRHLRPLSAVMLDLDHFKRVNDAHGHATGDRVLVALAGLLNALLRRTDLKARMGGDEFCLILPETGASSAHQLAERIRTGIQGLPFDAGGRTFQVTGSLGVAAYVVEESLEALVGRADRALYAAKESGRNRVVLAEA